MVESSEICLSFARPLLVFKEVVSYNLISYQPRLKPELLPDCRATFSCNKVRAITIGRESVLRKHLDLWKIVTTLFNCSHTLVFFTFHLGCSWRGKGSKLNKNYSDTGLAWLILSTRSQNFCSCRFKGSTLVQISASGIITRIANKDRWDYRASPIKSVVGLNQQIFLKKRHLWSCWITL